ncbi:MAG: hypothetical protein DRQ02_02300 [Candidatus Latescibacterota bacterium]|nr:MAG: hypothetical protein DRQ02_02300 [Candidatus Latescibacterota bacterium]
MKDLKSHRQVAERFLLHIWDGQHLKKEMRTTDGETVRVECAGTWNFDSGPDFKNALIHIGGRTVTGDVEIHIKPRDWTAHGHHRDPRYNGVILHAVMWQTEASFETVKENGETVSLLVLSDFLDEDIEKLSRKISQQQGWRCPRIAEIEQIDTDALLKVIDAAAQQRLEGKIDRFKKRLKELSEDDESLSPSDAWDQLLYEGVMEALGYSKNKEPFAELARRLPLKQIRDRVTGQPPSSLPLKIQAMLFGVAGLLPSQSHRPVELDRPTLQYIQELERQWQLVEPTLGGRKMEAEQWQFFRLRPANFPTRRIAGVSFLLSRSIHKSLLSHLLQIAREHNQGLFLARAKAAFTAETDDYWSKHYRFGRTARAWGENNLLIGTQRADDIVINVVFPVAILYARSRRMKTMEEFLLNCYDSYGELASNEITRSLVREILRGRRRISSSVKSARRQQGLIHIYRQFCQRLNCAQCPLLRCAGAK